MGICHCSKSNNEDKKAKVKIGGGEDGLCTWTTLKGVK